jgi:hypothetical protein
VRSLLPLAHSGHAAPHGSTVREHAISADARVTAGLASIVARASSARCRLLIPARSRRYYVRIISYLDVPAIALMMLSIFYFSKQDVRWNALRASFLQRATHRPATRCADCAAR